LRPGSLFSASQNRYKPTFFSEAAGLNVPGPEGAGGVVGMMGGCTKGEGGERGAGAGAGAGGFTMASASALLKCKSGGGEGWRVRACE